MKAKIADYLSRSGLTTAEAARYCGVSEETLLAWLAGEAEPSQQELDILQFMAEDAELEALPAREMPLQEQIEMFRRICIGMREEKERMKEGMEALQAELSDVAQKLDALERAYPGAKLQALAPEREVRCQQCGSTFTARRKNATYCSNACRQAAKYEKTKLCKKKKETY